jgi:hypothetical protein
VSDGGLDARADADDRDGVERVRILLLALAFCSSVCSSACVVACWSADCAWATVAIISVADASATLSKFFFNCTIIPSRVWIACAVAMASCPARRCKRCLPGPAFFPPLQRPWMVVPAAPAQIPLHTYSSLAGARSGAAVDARVE